MKLNKFWKKQLIICVAIFLPLLLIGYLLRSGVVIVLGIILVCLSAVVAERGLRCPACKEECIQTGYGTRGNRFPVSQVRREPSHGIVIYP